MRRILVLLITTVLLLFLSVVPSVADEKIKDHPLMSRYQGADYYDSEISEYGEYVLPMAPHKFYLAAKMEHPDGDVYLSLYITPTKNKTIIQQDIIETLIMEEVADYLQQNPSQDFYIVGHTTTLGPH